MTAFDERSAPEQPLGRDDQEELPKAEGLPPRRKNDTWAELMKHGLNVDVLACPCGKRMKLICVVLDEKSLRRLLRAAGLNARIAALHPARGPPQGELDFGP